MEAAGLPFCVGDNAQHVLLNIHVCVQGQRHFSAEQESNDGPAAHPLQMAAAADGIRLGCVTIGRGS